MLERWRKAVDIGDCFGVLLIDVSKTFDCLLREMLNVKLQEVLKIYI